MHVQGCYFAHKVDSFDDLVPIACVTGGFADEGNAGQRKQAANTLHARHAKASATQTIVAIASWMHELPFIIVNTMSINCY